MPNWCKNTLIVYGPAEILEGFVVRARGKVSVDTTPIESLLVPAALCPEDPECRATNLLNCMLDYQPGDSRAQYGFVTRYTGPIRVLHTIAKEFPLLTFSLETTVEMSLKSDQYHITARQVTENGEVVDLTTPVDEDELTKALLEAFEQLKPDPEDENQG